MADAALALRVFHLQSDQLLELPQSPAGLPARGFVWVGISRSALESALPELQAALQRWTGDQLQEQLLNPHSQFSDWRRLLESRNALHSLEDTCEDQRSAMQEWLDALEEWPQPGDSAAARDQELLRVRSRDVLEHIERVLSHVRRLEQSAEVEWPR